MRRGDGGEFDCLCYVANGVSFRFIRTMLPFIKRHVILDDQSPKRQPAEVERRPLRADARRNHDALIEAAAATFAEFGVDAPIKTIAERAGLGVGTVYRRFPERSDLIAAVFRREVDDCADAADALVKSNEPFEALSLWIQRYMDLIMAKQGLAAALHSGEPAYASLPGYFEDRLVPVLQRLLTVAGETVRADVAPAELLRAVSLLCSPRDDVSAAQTGRMVALLIDGLRVFACNNDRN